jgi:hypothetical protein
MGDISYSWVVDSRRWSAYSMHTKLSIGEDGCCVQTTTHKGTKFFNYDGRLRFRISMSEVGTHQEGLHGRRLVSAT